MISDIPLGDVLSITDGALVSRDHIDGVYRVLNFMTGDNLYTHQLPRAADECRPEILRQHPWLAKVPSPKWVSDPSVDGAREAEVYAWLAAQEAIYGTHVRLSPMPTEDHTQIDPIQELAMNFPAAEVIVVEMGELP